MKQILPNLISRPCHKGNSFRSRQRGVSIIAGIFLLLLMAVLAGLMANLLSLTHLNMAADMGGSRAYQAARAGAEWGMFQLDPNAQSATLPTCAGVVTPFPAIPGHVMAISCTAYPSAATSYQEGAKQIRIFHIVATATAVGVKAPGIQREVAVTVEKCRDPAITVAPFDC